MQHITNNGKQHLVAIHRLLSTYQALTLPQLVRSFPDLSPAILTKLLRRLEKSGRLVYDTKTDMVLHTKECSPNPALIKAYWVLLDFQSEVTYHTTSEYPVELTFCTKEDYYDVIYASPQKEILINHALSNYDEDAPKRIIIVEDTGQIPLITIPAVAAFCLVSSDGVVKYFIKQGETDT